MPPVIDTSFDDTLVPAWEFAEHLKCDEDLLLELARTTLKPHVKRVHGKGVHFRWGDFTLLVPIIREGKRERRLLRARLKSRRTPIHVLAQTPISSDDVAIMLGIPKNIVRRTLELKLSAQDEITRATLWDIITTGMAVHRGERAAPSAIHRYIPQAIKDAVRARDQNLCRYCAVTLNKWKMVFDHVVPVVQAGPHTVENLAQACRSCNHRKYAKTPEEAGMPLLMPGTARKRKRRAA